MTEAGLGLCAELRVAGVSETIPRGSQLPEERRGVEPS